VPLIRSVTGRPVCGGTGVGGVETGSGAAGGTALANGVASRPTEPKRDRKARREEEPRGASVPSPLFLLVSSDMVSVFGSRCSGKLVLMAKDSQLADRSYYPVGGFSIFYPARGTNRSYLPRYRPREGVLSRFCSPYRALAKNGPRMDTNGTANGHEEHTLTADGRRFTQIRLTAN
jgi:hypothetical protein